MTELKPTRWRRDRIFPFLTLLVAGGFAFGSWRLADHVKRMNSVRLFGELMTAGMQKSDPTQAMRMNPILPYMPALVQPRGKIDIKDAEQREQQIAYAEGVIFVWQRVMLGVSALLALIAIFSFVKKISRLLNLVAAGIILLSTAATIVALQLLINPNKGGMPRLSNWSYVLAAVVQSAYAVVLLFAFAFSSRPAKRIP